MTEKKSIVQYGCKTLAFQRQFIFIAVGLMGEDRTITEYKHDKHGAIYLFSVT